jgi:hypothetical protein
MLVALNFRTYKFALVCYRRKERKGYDRLGFNGGNLSYCDGQTIFLPLCPVPHRYVRQLLEC